jgi:predicted nucleotidyltransferase
MIGEPSSPFTKTQQRVLGVLFGHPERSFYASELIRDAGTGSGALKPLSPAIRAAFVYGSVAKATDQSASDIDLLIISDSLTYGEVFGALERMTRTVGRKVNPTVYTAAEFSKRARTENAFVTRVIEQPKLWVIGSEDDLPVAA